jgi:hypothetical protein
MKKCMARNDNKNALEPYYKAQGHFATRLYFISAWLRRSSERMQADYHHFQKEVFSFVSLSAHQRRTMQLIALTIMAGALTR